jgi:hypothetical protein
MSPSIDEAQQNVETRIPQPTFDAVALHPPLLPGAGAQGRSSVYHPPQQWRLPVAMGLPPLLLLLLLREKKKKKNPGHKSHCGCL